MSLGTETEKENVRESNLVHHGRMEMENSICFIIKIYFILMLQYLSTYLPQIEESNSTNDYKTQKGHIDLKNLVNLLICIVE